MTGAVRFTSLAQDLFIHISCDTQDTHGSHRACLLHDTSTAIFLHGENVLLSQVNTIIAQPSEWCGLVVTPEGLCDVYPSPLFLEHSVSPTPPPRLSSFLPLLSFHPLSCLLILFSFFLFLFFLSLPFLCTFRFPVSSSYVVELC